MPDTSWRRSAARTIAVARTRIVTPLLAILVLFFGPVLRGWGQEGVTMTILAGAGGYVRPNAIAAIDVFLTNQGEDVRGRVVASFPGPATETVSVSRALNLPGNARKRLTLYLRVPSGADSVRVDLVRGEAPSAGRRTLATIHEKIVPLDSEVPVFASVGELPRGLPPQYESRTDNAGGIFERKRYATLLLQPEQVPDRHTGLEMYDVLFLRSPHALKLNEAQTRAIADWVLRGGALVTEVVEDAESYRRGTLARLLPFSVHGRHQARVDALGSSILFTQTQIRAGRAILGPPDAPLAATRNYGLGTVTAFAFDLNEASFATWPGREATWHDVLWVLERQSPAFVDEMMGTLIAEDYRDIAEGLVRGRNDALPGAGWSIVVVLGLTAVYTLAAGPGDYLMVKRLAKPKMTWVTFPAMIAVFTLAALVVTRLWFGVDRELWHTQRTMIFQDVEQAVRYDVASMFCTLGTDYTISDDRGLAPEHLGTLYGVTDRAHTDGDTGVLAQRIPIWTARGFATSETATAYPDIEVQAEQLRWGLRLAVRNGTDLPIRPIFVAFESHVWTLNSRPVDAHSAQDLELNNDQASYDVLQEGVDLWMPQGEGAPYSAALRELDARDALRRGAVVATFETRGAQSPIRVDGARAEDEDDTHIVQVVLFLKNEDQTEGTR